MLLGHARALYYPTSHNVIILFALLLDTAAVVRPGRVPAGFQLNICLMRDGILCSNLEVNNVIEEIVLALWDIMSTL